MNEAAEEQMDAKRKCELERSRNSAKETQRGERKYERMWRAPNVRIKTLDLQMRLFK